MGSRATPAPVGRRFPPTTPRQPSPIAEGGVGAPPPCRRPRPLTRQSPQLGAHRSLPARLCPRSWTVSLGPHGAPFRRLKNVPEIRADGSATGFSWAAHWKLCLGTRMPQAGLRFQSEVLDQHLRGLGWTLVDPCPHLSTHPSQCGANRHGRVPEKPSITGCGCQNRTRVFRENWSTQRPTSRTPRQPWGGCAHTSLVGLP